MDILNTSFHLNGSNMNYEMHLPRNHIPFYVVLCLEAIVTISGNGMLCWLFATQRKLRTKQNHFIISLSLSDLLIGLAVIPCEPCHWELDKGSMDETCAHLCGSTISFNMTASVINLIMIATDRYISIEKPYMYEQLFSKTRALILIAFGWVVSILVTILPLTWEVMYPLTHEKKHFINVIFSATMFSATLLSGLILFMFYHKIVSTLKKTVQSSRRHAPAVKFKSTGIKVCILSTILFFICWIPSTVTEILMQAEFRIPHVFGDGSYFILMLGPCLDPMLYAYYRKGFRECLINWCRNRWMPIKNICIRAANGNRLTRNTDGRKRSATELTEFSCV